MTLPPSARATLLADASGKVTPLRERRRVPQRASHDTPSRPRANVRKVVRPIPNNAETLQFPVLHHVRMGPDALKQRNDTSPTAQIGPTPPDNAAAPAPIHLHTHSTRTTSTRRGVASNARDAAPGWRAATARQRSHSLLVRQLRWSDAWRFIAVLIVLASTLLLIEA
ncbi:MAG: hypothetical protein AAF499_13265 [Pseudomonadota bacterium]